MSYLTPFCAPRSAGSAHLFLAAILALAAMVGLAPRASYGSTLWTASASPAILSSSDTGAYELGVKFQSNVSGYVVAFRFYKGSGNTGTHIGHLWSSTGSLLATTTFTGESASGWQQVNLSAPIPITANTVYVASYWNPDGHYSVSQNYFTAAHNNGPLQALANGTDGPNGVYLRDHSGFPNQSYEASNYWVDVVFVPATGAGIWTSSASPSTPSFADSSSNELGVKFRSDVSGYITALRFYKGSGNTGTHVGHLWSGGGSLLATATFTNESASGWQQANFSAPVAISANAVYVASYWDPNGHYALSRPYFTTAYDNPPLHALANGTDGPNGAYLFDKSGFPTDVYDASNYWVDMVFVPSKSGGSTTPAPGALLLTGSPGSLHFGNVTLGSSSTLPVVVNNTGGSSVTISQATVSGAGFRVSSPSLPLALGAGQNATFSVTFAPTTAGAVTGSLSVASNASGSPTVVSLSGTGVNKHSVTLSWAASTSSNVAGYNVYRGTTSGGPYTQINSSLITGLSYADSTVEAGQTYYYVTAAVNSQGVRSAYSNQVAAGVPSP